MCMSCCYRNVISILTFGSGVGRYDQNITSLISYRYFIVSPRLSHESAAPSGQSESTSYPAVHSQPLFFFHQTFRETFSRSRVSKQLFLMNVHPAQRWAASASPAEDESSTKASLSRLGFYSRTPALTQSL